MDAMENRIDCQALYRMAFRLLADGAGPLFGDPDSDNARRAFDAFCLCDTGDAMPILYFEIPLSGEPRFDLQVCIDRAMLAPGAQLPEGAPAQLQSAIDWLLADEAGVVGVDFAFDVSKDDTCTPQIIAFTNGCQTADLDAFFACAGDAAAARRYEAADRRAPQGWRSWYTGLLPQRSGRPVRLDYFVDKAVTARYARDVGDLAKDLEQMGYAAGPFELERCVDLLEHPFALNIQLDVTDDGSLGPVLGYNAAFGRLGAGAARSSCADGGIARIMELVERWGLADSRWRHLADCCLGRAVPLPDGHVLIIRSAPTFLKVRMTPDSLLDAKVYVICEVLDVEVSFTDRRG